jgi:hypothetical protein
MMLVSGEGFAVRVVFAVNIQSSEVHASLLL